MTRSQIIIELEIARKAQGLTYKELAYRCVMTPDTVRGALQGWRMPTLVSLLRICKVLGLAVTVAERQPFEMG